MITLPENLTIRDAYSPAMEIDNKEAADEYFEALVKRSITYFGTSRQEAENVQRQNLGYYTGYYDEATRERVERLFSCSHPIFGSITKNGTPSAEEAFKLGQRLTKNQ
jgi:hypothetical protein